MAGSRHSWLSVPNAHRQRGEPSTSSSPNITCIPFAPSQKNVSHDPQEIPITAAYPYVVRGRTLAVAIGISPQSPLVL